jgi:ribonuclease P protein component
VPASLPKPCTLVHAAGGAPEEDSSGRFTRGARLLSPAEFKHVFSGACKVGGRYLTLLARANVVGHPRLGLAISRKQVKTAVGRNLIKRQVRESFRLHQSTIGNFDVVILGKAGVDKLSRHELRSLIDSYWQELAKRCKSS